MDQVMVERIGNVLMWMTSVGAVLLLLAPLQRWYRVTLTLLAGVAMLGVVHLELYRRYGAGISALVLALLAETEAQEALPLLWSTPWTVWLPMVLVLLLWGLALWIGRPPRRWPGVWLVLTGALLLVPAMGFTHAIAVYHDREAARRMAAGEVDTRYQPDALSPLLTPWQQDVRSAFPVSLVYAVSDFLHERRSMARAVAERQSLHFGARAEPRAPGEPRRIQVLVIGETSRADRWSLNGFARPTTPLLAARNDVVSFARFHSPLTYTRLSVPVMLSRRPPDWPTAVYPERSLLAAASEAGLRTVWISNQAPVGFHDSPIALLARDAGTVIHANPADYRSRGVPDRALLPYIDRVLAQDDPRDLLLVVHTLGNHFRYSDRYDPADAHFLPDRPPNGKVRLYDRGHATYLRNSYDNALRETDRLLDALIGRLADTGLPAWVFYVADHGEALFDDCLGEVGHGQSSPATHSVAALWWASPAWRQFHTAQATRMEAHRDALLSTTHVFETVLSLAGVVVPGARPGKDISGRSLVVPAEILALDLDAPRCSADGKPLKKAGSTTGTGPGAMAVPGRQ